MGIIKRFREQVDNLTSLFHIIISICSFRVLSCLEVLNLV